MKISRLNLEVSLKCLKEKHIQGAITHLLNAFLWNFNLWIIHPEPTKSEQLRIYKVYKKAGIIGRSIVYVLTCLIWFKTPEKLHKSRMKI